MKNQENYINQIEKIKNDFFKKLNSLRLKRDKEIQKILDKNKMRKICKYL